VHDGTQDRAAEILVTGNGLAPPSPF
jgi:hypothetical protein